MLDDYYVSQFSGEEQDALLALVDGYGLGTAGKMLTSSDDLDNLTAESGWYRWSQPPAKAPELISPSGASWCSMLLLGTTQIVVSLNSRSNMAMRTKTSAGWSSWEYINPHMALGVEYRTTERYLGKPVYAKVTDCGALPNATYKTIQTSFPNMDAIVSITGTAYLDVDHIIPLPCQDYGGDAYSTARAVQVKVSGPDNITIVTATDMSAFGSSSVCVKYTKSTD